MRIRAGYNRISGTSIRSHRHHATTYTGQNGQDSSYSPPQVAAGSYVLRNPGLIPPGRVTSWRPQLGG
jgi:hypothetical protein